MLHAVIMAGGSGTRFWPESRRLVPKQLLNLVGDRTMIQSTVDRLAGLIAPQQVRVITNEVLVERISQQLPELKRANIVGEPCRRDTAPCVGLAAAMVAAEDPEGIMAMLPADHVIDSPDQFQAALNHGADLVRDDPQRIVTFGITPTYPAESFGYIERSAALPPAGASHSGLGASHSGAYQVARFREKPDRVTAQSYIDAGTFYWNSGIFVWKAATILQALEKFEPEMYGHIAAIADSIGSDRFESVLRSEFSAIVGKSIDFAVMERHDNVVVIEAPFGWDDVGSWQSLARLKPSDDAGNTADGDFLGIDSRHCVVRCQPGHTIVAIDTQDLIIVQTKDATLVAPKSAEERVREVVQQLTQRGRDDLL